MAKPSEERGPQVPTGVSAGFCMELKKQGGALGQTVWLVGQRGKRPEARGKRQEARGPKGGVGKRDKRSHLRLPLPSKEERRRTEYQDSAILWQG